MKRCTACKIEKSLTQFYFVLNANGKYYPRAKCKECTKEERCEYRKTHPDTRTAAQRTRNLEKERQTAQRWRQAHPGYEDDYHQRNPGKRAEKNARRRACRIDAFVENVDRMEVFRRDEGKCGICQQAVDVNDFHIDHIIPLSRGGDHSYANSQLAHPLCNQRKSNKTV